MNEFEFSSEQRKQLILAGLKNYPSDLIQVFLNESQRIIREWVTNYPTGGRNNNKSRVGIEKLTTQLDKTHGYLRSLPDEAKNHLAVYWKHGEYKRKGWPADVNEIECFLLALHRCATDLIQPGGISKSIESSMVEELAWAFVDTFKETPTTTPSGPFMGFLKHLSENILTPQIRSIVFGKDLIAEVLRHVRERLDEYDKFIKS
jgi:hypothetical protein